MEQLYPFYIGAGTGQGAITRLDIDTNESVEAELVVLSGGVVFLFGGRRENADAFFASHPDQQTPASAPDFDLAASPNIKGRLFMGQLSQVTLHSDVESVGYLKLTER